MEEEIQSTDKSIRKNMICNHCMFDCENHNKMKEHYQSEFHKYNLNRVTMNLNPLVYSEYIKKKEQYQKKVDEMNQRKAEEEAKEKKCEICIKQFSNSRKFREHMRSKAHIKMDNAKKQQQQQKEPETQGLEVALKPVNKREDKTTKDDTSICLFCNEKSTTLDDNMIHMVNKHQLDVPFLHCIKNNKRLMDFFVNKIFEHNACLTCDSQNFNSHRSLQSHMIDKNHTRINKEDLDEHLSKLYDMKKLLGIKDINIRKMPEFQLLLLRHKINMRMKEDKGGDKPQEKGIDDEWEDLGEYDANEGKEIEDYEPMQLPNGELLLEDGTVLGNRIYNVYYKQRIHYSKYEPLQRKVKEAFMDKKNQMKKYHQRNKKQSYCK